MISWLFTISLSFFYVPKLFRALGQEPYGIWVLVFSIIGILSFLQFGFDTSLVRHVAHAKGVGNMTLLNNYVVSGLFFYGVVALVGCLCIVIFATLGGSIWLGISPIYADTAMIVFKITGAVFAFQTLNMWLSAVLRGLENYVILSSISIGTGIVTYPVGLAVLHGGFGLSGIVLSQVVWLSIVFLGGTIVLGMKYSLKISRQSLRKRDLGEQLGFGAPFFIITVFSTITSQGDRIILGNILGASAIPLYSIPQRLTLSIQSSTSSVFAVLYPRMVNLRSQQENLGSSANKEKHLFSISIRLQLSIIAMLIVPMLVVGRGFLTVWIGKEFANVATPVLWILGGVCLLNGARYIIGMRIATERKAIILFAKLMLPYVLLFICGVYFGATLFGVIGVAVGVLISEAYLVIISYLVGFRSMDRDFALSTFSLVFRWIIIVLSLSIIGIILSEYFRLAFSGWFGVFIYGIGSALIVTLILGVLDILPTRFLINYEKAPR